MGGWGCHTGCKIIWESWRCRNFCKPLQQQADLRSPTKNVAAIDLRHIFYIRNYSPSEYSIVLRSCPVGKRAWVLSTSSLKMLHGLAFHDALPKSPPPVPSRPAFQPRHFQMCRGSVGKGWEKAAPAQGD